MTILFAILLAGHVGGGSVIYPWLACNTAGKAVPVTWDAGDEGTLPFPGPRSKPPYVAFFTTQNISGDFTGKTITVRFHVTGAPNWSVGYGPGPATLHLFFTTRTGYYNLNDADRNPLEYWWSNPISVPMTSANNSTIDVTVSLDPSQWSDANGCEGTACEPGFASAVSRVAQIGFSFGGSNFFDTGVQASIATTLHLWLFQVQ